MNDENGDLDYNNTVEDPILVNRIMNELGNVDYIYQAIQECVDEIVEEQSMLHQQELDESPLVQ